MTPAEELEVIEALASFERDPLGFVLWAFPWGEPGTELEHERLEDWQYEYFDTLGKRLRANPHQPIRMARASGHGIGKSAGTGMLTWWSMSTFEGAKGIITANTENQLKTKTWPEIVKWHRLFIARDLFNVTATAIFPRDEEMSKTWRIDVVPWSERNTEAFAGLHNVGRRVFVLFDEASAIPDQIHEVTEGALTDADTQIIWGMYGNPTRNKGRFREAAPDGKFGQRWDFKAIDSRSVRRTNKQQLAEWEADYGEDSDFFRVRVRGVFPRSDTESFISLDQARAAVNRELPEWNDEDVILGVDVGRTGDPSCIFPRQGRDARSRPPTFIFNEDTVSIAFAVRDAVYTYNAQAVFVDETGIGVGVLDNLRKLDLPCLVFGVHFSAKPDNDTVTKYANKRAEIWGRMKDAIIQYLCIAEHLPKREHTLLDELTAPQYGYNAGDAVQLESKKDMRARLTRERGSQGNISPDGADALACTFAMPLPPVRRDRYGRRLEEKPHVAKDYDPYAEEMMYA